MTRRLILSTRGPLRLLQFAFSAESVREAIVERAKLEKADGNVLDLKSVGDAPFAVRPWSVFLALAGYELKEEGEAKEYVEAASNALRAVLGAKAYEALRENIRVASRTYRDHHYKPDADTPAIDYGAKLHHKVLISGLFAVLGTSFNFSEAANSNQEQYIVTSDSALVAAMNAVFDGFFALTTISLGDEVLRRNGFLKGGGDDDLKVGGQYKHVDEEGGRARRK
jgi:phosphatidylserine/phosphatidylglycerophosphate/cardiolipin synthase-like enzyme